MVIKESEPMEQIERKFVATSWHSISGDEALSRLSSSLLGLSDEEAENRRKKFGKNILPAPKPPRLFVIFFRQFLSPLIYVLLAASAVSILIGEAKDAFFIFLVILINAMIGTYQEWSAEKSASALQMMLKVRARVRRGGARREIDAEELVPGDIVYLESGSRVPADLRLLEVRDLAIDESLLTGESVEIAKTEEPLPEDTNLADRLNMAYAGSTVTRGRAIGVVVATGKSTEVGKIAELTSVAETTKPPLVIRMEEFARRITFIVLGSSFLLALISLAKGIPYLEVFFLAVALAVSAIPEGLPVAITVALSVATTRMARRSVIVRKLTAVEGLGSCTYIASDKTGTLTVNMQTVKLIEIPSGERFVVTGEGYAGEGEVLTEEGDSLDEQATSLLREIGKVVAICNEASLTKIDGEWKHQGDPLDVALLALSYKLGLRPEELLEKAKILAEIPFESERRFVARVYSENGVPRVVVKGATETIIKFCKTMRTRDGIADLDAEAIESNALKLAEGGYRVIAIAAGDFEYAESLATFNEEDIPPLTFLGLAGLIDPLRPEAKDAVKRCHEAGVKVGIVTGDHPATALAIAKELGIAKSMEHIVTGRELEEIDPQSEEFVEKIKGYLVFARVSPAQKLNIVNALIKAGHFVAVTGDGVNDAPALKAANIGIAMGSGTDVAKDASLLIVTDDNFASIVAGIEEGRYAYDNIRKVTYLLVSTGAAEIALFMLALVLGLPLPLLPVQLLWLNLVTNGFQHIALAFEAGEKEAMQRKPRDPKEGIFDRLMTEQVALSGAVMGILACGVFYYLTNAGWEEGRARNLLFLLMVILENVHVFNCRSEYKSVFKVSIRRNLLLPLGIIAAHGVHMIALYIPLSQSILKVSPVTFAEWASMLAISLAILVLMEIYKVIRVKKLKKS